MTLNEKFDEVFIENWLSDYAKECEIIADDFAIEFALWYRQNYIKHTILGNVKSDEELLKIYKKEKGL